MTEREFGDTAHIIVLAIGYGRTFQQAVDEFDLEDTPENRRRYAATQKNMAQMKSQGVAVDTINDGV